MPIRCSIILMLFLGSISNAQDYKSLIAKAGESYEKNRYDSCVYFFHTAFSLHNPTGNELYNAAICNIYIGEKKEALSLLNRSVSKGINIAKLHVDPELEPLHDSRKWKKLLRKSEKIRSDSFAITRYPLQAAQLAKLWEKDQYYRFRLGQAYRRNDTTLANKLWKQMRQTDSITLLEFQSILDQIGWPTISKVGKWGAATAFLIIDHAPREVMEKYFPQLEEAAFKGEASLSSFATLKDRILVNRNAKQIYGTQKYWDAAQGKFVFFPIENEKEVNSKRKEVGLAPLKEFENQ